MHRIVNFVLAEDGADRCQPKFTQEETEILVQEVQARFYPIYGTMSKPPDEVKPAREEAAYIINGFPLCCKKQLMI